jgi:hypothetical protein
LAKTEIKLPVGFECKDGTCLEKPLEFEVDIPEVKPLVKVKPDAIIKNQKIQSMENNEIPEIKEKIVEKVTKVVPSWQPNFICKGPNCNTKKNPAYAQRPNGKCSNCGQFTKESFGTCIWCNSKEIEELDPEELDNLGIPTPEQNEPDLEEAD